MVYIMIGKIKGIKLNYTDKGAYWEIIIVDENDILVGTFGSAEKSDAINFRMQTFGLMKILNNMNLFNLGNQNKSIPILVKGNWVRVESIANENGEFFSVDRNADMQYGMTTDLSAYELANIDSFHSKSGILALRINKDNSAQDFELPKVYRGFKQVYDVVVEKQVELLGAQEFLLAVCGILKVCKIEELLPQNAELSNLPLISYVLDNDGKIHAIGNLEQDYWLTNATDEYILSSELTVGNIKYR